ncbi:hypothetical protein ZEAMMB73_Zm00001d043362 [Zea mays]|uniref:Uncharacterized protein n=1 Tax=Zea mays TaxID=4577 RepID=A0A1D6NAX7_MAIZE|nr:hypothetical protein ZEAMMB73_Zm00001d043362 [Zea mays]
MPECPIFFVYLISSSLTYWQRKVYGWHLENNNNTEQAWQTPVQAPKVASA